MFKARLLDQILSPETLNLAWRRVRVEHTPWSKGVNRDQLEQHLLKHIFELAEEVRSGHYRPEPLRQFTIPKSDGKKRVISSQYLRDKFLQRAFLIVLEQRAETIFHNDSYAYRPHRGVKDALHKTRERVYCGLDWLVDADIKHFFDQISHKILRQKLKSFIADKEVLAFFDLWLKQGAHHASFLGSSRGIAQGAILSPLMCNLYLHEFDLALTKANIPFVRYADDFILFASTKTEAEKAHAFVGKLLNKFGLVLHPEKTSIVRSSPRVYFLGESLPTPKR